MTSRIIQSSDILCFHLFQTLPYVLTSTIHLLNTCITTTKKTTTTATKTRKFYTNKHGISRRDWKQANIRKAVKISFTLRKKQTNKQKQTPN